MIGMNRGSRGSGVHCLKSHEAISEAGNDKRRPDRDQQRVKRILPFFSSHRRVVSNTVKKSDGPDYTKAPSAGHRLRFRDFHDRWHGVGRFG